MGDVLLDTAVNHLRSWNLSIEVQRLPQNYGSLRAQSQNWERDSGSS